jgi:hypothetical protein
MNAVSERWDEDADYLYIMARKIGKLPSDEQEDQFCNRVFELVSGGMEAGAARRLEFARLFG